MKVVMIWLIATYIGSNGGQSLCSVKSVNCPINQITISWSKRPCPTEAVSSLSSLTANYPTSAMNLLTIPNLSQNPKGPYVIH